MWQKHTGQEVKGEKTTTKNEREKKLEQMGMVTLF